VGPANIDGLLLKQHAKVHFGATSKLPVEKVNVG